MYMSAQARKAKEPTPREVLAQAIADLAESTEKVKTYPAIVEKARLVMAEARRKYNLALGYLEEVKQSRADKLIREASGGDSPAHEIFIRQARNKATEMEDELDAAKSALETLEKHLAEWKAVEANERLRVEKAVDAVLVAEIDTARLIEEAEAIQQDLIVRRMGLRYLHANILPGSNRDPRKEAISSFLQRRDRDLPGLENTYELSRHPINGAWEKARELLVQDASAPVPVK